MDVKNHIKNNIDKTTKRHHAISGEDTLIPLPFPFTTPCADGMFQEMYYWDTYFTNKGLFRMEMGEQAVNNIRNMAYLLDFYGKIPNGNRTYYLNRSQPPFFGAMLADALAFAPEQLTLTEAYCWLEQEYEFWKQKRGTPVGLNRYNCDYTDEECEEPGITQGYTMRTGRRLEPTAVNGRNVLAECESGWDFSPRFQGHCTDFAPVDLNCLLYHDEMLLAQWAKKLNLKQQYEAYLTSAMERQTKMKRTMKHDGIYYDYDFVSNRCSAVVSCAALYPYAFGVDDSIQDFKKTLAHLEREWGVVACDDDTGGYQWSSPNSWAPLNDIAVMAAYRLGAADIGKRLTKKYIEATRKLFLETGNLWEKYDGMTGKLTASNEYETPPMLGWTAGVYLALSDYIRE